MARLAVSPGISFIRSKKSPRPLEGDEDIIVHPSAVPTDVLETPVFPFSPSQSTHETMKRLCHRPDIIV